MADGRVEISVNLDNKEAGKKLRDLRRSIEKTAKDIESTGGKKAAITEQLEQARKAARETADEIKLLNAERLETKGSIAGMEENGEKGSDDYQAAKQALKEQNYQLKEQIKLRDQQATRIADLEEKERNLTSQLEQQTASLEQQKASAGEVERVIASQASSAMPQLSASAEAVSKSMQKGFKNILKWGFGIRSAFVLMRRLRSAVVEGVKAFAAQDEETRNNINGLKASLSTLKASWGAAFAPVFNAIVPILQKLISWLTAAANAIAMFFSALTGKSTYKKAIANNNSLAESYGGAGAAAEEAEGQIMGFDEINKLNANDDKGGGGGGGAGDIAEQFEEIPILESFKKHLDDILIIVGLIGAALLAWKLAPLLGISFAKMFGILAAIIGLVEMVHGGLDAWNNGVNWENFFDMLKGAALLVGGLALAFGTTGAAIGLLIAGVALLVVGLHDWITAGELSTETFHALEAGILAVGIGLSLLTGSWIPLVVAAVVGLALAIYKYWDEIKAKWDLFWDNLSGKWNTVKENFKKSFSEFGTAAKKSLQETWDNIQRAASDAWNNLKRTVSETIDKIKGFLNFEWHLPHLPMPHVILTAGEWPWGIMGRGVPPNVDIKWYAKGGIVDGATLFGAGEAGKEAIIPLERNTGWINMVADGIIDRLMSSNALADFISGRALPAVASGQIVPPNAIGNGGNALSDSDISRLVSGFMASLAPMLAAVGSRQPMVATLNVNGREFCRATFYDQQDVVSEHGISLITR